MDALQDDNLHTIAEFLDPPSLRQWCIAAAARTGPQRHGGVSVGPAAVAPPMAHRGRAGERSEDADGGGGADSPPPPAAAAVVLASSLLRRALPSDFAAVDPLGAALGGGPRARRPRPSAAPPPGAAAGEEEDGGALSWRRKRDLYSAAYCRWTKEEYYHVPDELVAWLAGESVPSQLISLLVHFMLEFAARTVAFCEYRRGVHVHLIDCLRASEGFGLILHPMEKVHEVELLDETRVEATVQEMASYQFSVYDEVSLDNAYPSLTTSSREDQIESAKDWFGLYLQKYTKEKAALSLRRDLHFDGDTFDPYECESLVENDSCGDGEWEEWIASIAHTCQLWPERQRSQEEIEAVESAIRSKLKERIASLPSLAPDNSSSVSPNFRLCHKTFGDIANDAFRKCRAPNMDDHMCISPSALNFFQRVVEDFVFGVALDPFEVEHADVARPLLGHLLVGRHGTTMFALDRRDLHCDDVDEDDDSDYEMEDADD